MNWGKWIVVSFIAFAAFIGVLVAVCVRQDISLVSKDYYRDELAYQEQIDRLENTNGLSEKPTLSMAGDSVEIQFNRFGEVETGELILYRPSNGIFDKRFLVMPSLEKMRRFDVHALPKGMYRAKMVWTMNGKEYFVEDMVNR